MIIIIILALVPFIADIHEGDESEYDTEQVLVNLRQLKEVNLQELICTLKKKYQSISLRHSKLLPNVKVQLSEEKY